MNQLAFQGCTNLTGLRKTNPNNKLCCHRISQGAFYGCGRLTSLEFDESDITSIGTNAFNGGCGLLTTSSFNNILSNNLSTIGTSAFQGCASITTVDLSKTAVTSIGQLAFASCGSLTTLKLPSAMFAEGNSATIGDRSFAASNNLNAIYIPSGAKAIPASSNANAFSTSTNGCIYYYDGDKNVAESFMNFFDGLKSDWEVELAETARSFWMV
jgi:Leucine-rich repeat (LRR) protein